MSLWLKPIAPMTPFRRFEDLTKKLLSVPKKDVDKKQAERPKRKSTKRTR